VVESKEGPPIMKSEPEEEIPGYIIKLKALLRGIRSIVRSMFRHNCPSLRGKPLLTILPSQILKSRFSG